ncbi:hypothetical protein SGPA1_40267 [Streptomyces misionensis JCM 4497]
MDVHRPVRLHEPGARHAGRRPLRRPDLRPGAAGRHRVRGPGPGAAGGTGGRLCRPARLQLQQRAVRGVAGRLRGLHGAGRAGPAGRLLRPAHGPPALRSGGRLAGVPADGRGPGPAPDAVDRHPSALHGRLPEHRLARRCPAGDRGPGHVGAVRLRQPDHPVGPRGMAGRGALPRGGRDLPGAGARAAGVPAAAGRGRGRVRRPGVRHGGGRGTAPAPGPGHGGGRTGRGDAGVPGDGARMRRTRRGLGHLLPVVPRSRGRLGDPGPRDRRGSGRRARQHLRVGPPTAAVVAGLERARRDHGVGRGPAESQLARIRAGLRG